MIIDDATLFSPIHIDQTGKPQALTKAPFTVVNSTSQQGKEVYRLFEELWDSGQPFKSC
jgi:hypothetical protein